MNKQDVVRLSDDERGVCQASSKHLKGSSQKFRRAQLLLKADAEGPGWPDVRVADAFNCRGPTIETLRTRVVTAGVALALEGKKRRAPPTPGMLDGEAEATWLARRLGQPLAGYGHGTLPRLADALGAWELVDSRRHEAVRKVRKKTAGRSDRSHPVSPPWRKRTSLARPRRRSPVQNA